MIKFIALIAVALTSAPISALEYKMVEGDTLWSLSKKYLQDPQLWVEITYADGEAVTEPRTMPIGTLLLIREDIANEVAVQELESLEQPAETTESTELAETSNSSSTQEESKKLPVNVQKFPFIVNPSISRMVKKLDQKEKNKLWDYYLTDKNGLVRAFYNGKEVVIEVKTLIEQLRHLEGQTK